MIRERFINIIILVVIFIIAVVTNTIFTKETAVSVSNGEVKIDKECLEGYKKQKEYLDNETLSKEITFDKYKTSFFEPKSLADLDLDFSKTARTFRTAVGDQLYKYGVDFDGKYTITSVGMTGWDGPVWIVDRTNGRAYEFPYHHYGFSLKFQKDSNLIIVNSREDLEEIHRTQECYYLNVETKDGEYLLGYDLITQYFLWEDNKLKYLGPEEYKPSFNSFWDGYFKN